MSADPHDAQLRQQLRAEVRAALAALSPWQHVLRTTAPDRRLWRVLATEMGLADLALPERLGGAGASLRESAVVLEELGRTVAAVPYLTGAVVAGQTLLAAGADELLAQQADTGRYAVLAVPIDMPPGAAAGSGVQVQPSAAGGLLSGRVPAVADAAEADLLLVAAADALWLVTADAPGLTRTALVCLDQTRPLADLVFSGTPAQRLATGAAATVAVQRGLLAGAALLSAEQVGLAQWCLETTVEHLRTRHQFGRPLGSYQALRHRLADLWVEITQARAVSAYAVGAMADADPQSEPGRELRLAAALAQAYCAPVAVQAAQECVQLHGGLGFTWEHPAHLYLKRARTDAVAFGTADRHRATVADLADLAPA